MLAKKKKKNALAYHEESHGYIQISHASSNIDGLCECSCNLRDVSGYRYTEVPRRLVLQMAWVQGFISVKTNKKTNKTKIFCCCCQITALVQAQGFSLRVRSRHETHEHRWLAPIDQLGSCIQCPLTSPCTLFTSPFKLETYNNESVETIPVQSLAC